MPLSFAIPIYVRYTIIHNRTFTCTDGSSRYYRTRSGERLGQNSADAICINEAPDNGARPMNYVPMFELNEGT